MKLENNLNYSDIIAVLQHIQSRLNQQRLLKLTMNQRSRNESVCLHYETESHNRAQELQRTISAQRIHWPGKSSCTSASCDVNTARGLFFTL